LKIIAEPIANYDSYLGQPIESASDTHKLVQYRGENRSSEAINKLAQWSTDRGYEVSPAKLNHMLNVTFANFSALGTSLADHMIKDADSPERTLRDNQTFWGRVFTFAPTEINMERTGNIDKFYVAMEKATQTRERLSALQHQGREKDLDKFINDPRNVAQIGAAKFLTEQSKVMSVFNDQIRALDYEGGKGMTYEQRLAKKREIEKQKAQFAKDAVQIYHEYMAGVK